MALSLFSLDSAVLQKQTLRPFNAMSATDLQSSLWKHLKVVGVGVFAGCCLTSTFVASQWGHVRVRHQAGPTTPHEHQHCESLLYILGFHIVISAFATSVLDENSALGPFQNVIINTSPKCQSASDFAPHGYEAVATKRLQLRDSARCWDRIYYMPCFCGTH
eukprot:1353581-Amphidinium_carterae.1